MVRDRRIIFAASFLRAVANGLIGVLAGIYLAQLGLEPAAWGAVLGAGIAGTAVGAAGVMFWGDRIGRKRWLVGLGVLAAAGGVVFAFSSQIVVLGAAAFLGMLNSLGKDRAAALAIEQAILPSTGDDAGRTRAFAWYNVIQDVGHALGAALAVLPPLLRDFAGVDPLDSLRAAVILYAALYAATAVLYLGLASEAAIGVLYVGARIMNAFSHLGAAWLAARIGLVNTMVFTHTPSSILTFTIPFTGSFEVAAVLFLIREGLSEMDVPTRQSYLMAVVRPEERTFAGGGTEDPLRRATGRVVSQAQGAGRAVERLPEFESKSRSACSRAIPEHGARAGRSGRRDRKGALSWVSWQRVKSWLLRLSPTTRGAGRPWCGVIGARTGRFTIRCARRASIAGRPARRALRGAKTSASIRAAKKRRGPDSVPASAAGRTRPGSPSDARRRWRKPAA